MESYTLLRADGSEFSVYFKRPISLRTRRLLREAQQKRWSTYAKLKSEFKDLFDHTERPEKQQRIAELSAAIDAATTDPNRLAETMDLVSQLNALKDEPLPPNLIEPNFSFAQRWGDANDFFTVRQFQALIVRPGLDPQDLADIDSEVGGEFWGLQDVEMMEAAVARFLGGNAPAGSDDRDDARGMGHQQPGIVEGSEEAGGGRGEVVGAGSGAGNGAGAPDTLAGL